MFLQSRTDRQAATLTMEIPPARLTGTRRFAHHTGWLVAAALAILLPGSRPAAAQALAVAAASDVQGALPEIAARFEKNTGRKVTLTFGSSGNFFTQIQNGAPFDVFLSADSDFPRQLERAGLADLSARWKFGFNIGCPVRQNRLWMAALPQPRIPCARPCAGHSRLPCRASGGFKTWVAGTSPATRLMNETRCEFCPAPPCNRC